MPWVKLTDDFFDNVKVIRAGRDGRDLYLAGLCFCARRLTDGFIPDEQVARLAADAGIDNAPASVARLVEVNLWERIEQGYQVHHWAEYNPTREEVLALREARVQAGTIGGHHSGESKRKAKAEANAIANLKQNANPVPTTRSRFPDKTKTADAAASGANAPTEHQARFAALARGCGHDLEHLGDQERKSIGTQAANLRRFTPDQITTMCVNYPTHFRGAITAPMVAANASKLLAPGPYALSPPAGVNGRSNGTARSVNSGHAAALDRALNGSSSQVNTGSPAG